jgi:uncharacterized protein (TIGR00255 family)
MISSMTAFARKEYRDDQGELVWELRSVNHRYLETSVRLPEELRALEPVVRERIGKRLSRGKVDCNLRFRPSQSAATTISTNQRLATQLLEAAEEVGHLMHEGVFPTVMDILRWPGVLEIEAQDLTPVQKRAAELLDETIADLIAGRQREGERLGEMIRERTAAMRGHVASVREAMPKILEGIRERLKTRLEEVTQELDPNRLEQEMVLLTQRLDVDEEMDRLGSHLEEVDRVLEQDEPIGRRLDFLMQELNRESNTLSSKSSDVETTRIAVDMKVLIEQMREQVQNIE